MTRMKYVLYYQSADDVLEKAPLHRDAHAVLIEEFHEAGTLLMTGPFANPQEGAMSVFTTREAAEEFASRDPFVRTGVAKSWVVREWDERLV